MTHKLSPFKSRKLTGLPGTRMKVHVPLLRSNRLMPDGVVTSTNSETEESDAQSRIMGRPATGVWLRAISDKRISMVSIIIPRPVTCQAQRTAESGQELRGTRGELRVADGGRRKAVGG